MERCQFRGERNAQCLDLKGCRDASERSALNPERETAKKERLFPPNLLVLNRLALLLALLLALDNLSIRTIIGFGPLVSAAERRQVEGARVATGSRCVRQLTCFEEV